MALAAGTAALATAWALTGAPPAVATTTSADSQPPTVTSPSQAAGTTPAVEVYDGAACGGDSYPTSVVVAATDDLSGVYRIRGQWKDSAGNVIISETDAVPESGTPTDGSWYLPFTVPPAVPCGDTFFFQSGTVEDNAQNQATWFYGPTLYFPAAGTPAAATGVQGTLTTLDTAQVSWTPPTDTGSTSATSVVVTGQSGTAQAVSGTFPPDARSADLSGLGPGASYTFTVIYQNAQGDGAPSSPSGPVTTDAGDTGTTGSSPTPAPSSSPTPTPSTSPAPTLSSSPTPTAGASPAPTASASPAPTASASPAPGSIVPACPQGLADPFTDVGDDVAAPAIACLFHDGIVHGTTATTYSPSQPVTRAEMASFLARLLAAAGTALPAGFTNPFTDVPAGSTEQTAIDQLADLGMVRGTTATTYDPAGLVTRDQMAAFLARVDEYATGRVLPAAQTPFTDIAGNYFATDIAKIATAGITLGMTPTLYVPGANVARDQMALFVARTLNLIAR